MSGPITLIGRFIVRPETVEEARGIFARASGPSREEAGCLRFDLCRNLLNPAEFLLIEKWENNAAVDGHFEREHTRNALAQIQGLLKVVPDIRRYTGFDVAEARKGAARKTEPVILLSRVTIKGDRVKDAGAVFRELLGPSRSEAQCLRFDLHCNRIDPAEFLFIEEWESNEAADGHFSCEHVLRALDKSHALMASVPDVRRYTRLLPARQSA